MEYVDKRLLLLQFQCVLVLAYQAFFCVIFPVILVGLQLIQHLLYPPQILLRLIICIQSTLLKLSRNTLFLLAFSQNINVMVPSVSYFSYYSLPCFYQSLCLFMVYCSLGKAVADVRVA